MKNKLLIVAFALISIPGLCQAKASTAPCSDYFGIVEYDPAVPGSFIAKMSDPQFKWFAKKGEKEFPGLCLSLEKAHYLVVWTVATEFRTTQQTVRRTAEVNTSTVGQQDGSFRVSDTYGDLAQGTYNGTYSGNSTSTVSYDQTVPVTTAADHCSIYVVEALRNTIWEDIRSKSVQPQVIYSHETYRPRVAGNGDQSAAVIGHLFRREPTTSALDDALKFVFEQGAQAQPLAVFTAAPGKYATSSVPQQTIKENETNTGHETGQTPANALNANAATVSFSSDPSGADIYVDGNFMGSTPSQVQLPAGTHGVRIESKGRKIWNRTINLTASGTVSLNAILDADERR
jgi:hypothetical protein